MMHCIQLAFFFTATTASLFAFVSAGVSQDNSNDIVIGGMNGPVNFSRPEGLDIDKNMMNRTETIRAFAIIVKMNIEI